MSTVQKYWDTSFDIKMDPSRLPNIQDLLGYKDSLTMVTYQRSKMNNRCTDSCHRPQRKRATMTRRRFESLSLSETPLEMKSEVAEDTRPHKMLRSFSSPADVEVPQPVPESSEQMDGLNLERTSVTDLQSRLSPFTSYDITRSLKSNIASYPHRKQNSSKVLSSYETKLYHEPDHIQQNWNRGIGNDSLRLQPAQNNSRKDIKSPVLSPTSSNNYKGKYLKYLTYESLQINYGQRFPNTDITI